MGKTVRNSNYLEIFYFSYPDSVKRTVQNFNLSIHNTVEKKRKYQSSRPNAIKSKNPSKLRFIQGKFRGKINRKNGVNRCYTIYLPSTLDEQI
jgi:hypothetical protein